MFNISLNILELADKAIEELQNIYDELEIIKTEFINIKKEMIEIKDSVKKIDEKKVFRQNVNYSDCRRNIF
jgi:hypothetical protein